eukprot:Skav227011  [mRNA]  locus=scaffold456:22577:24307:+ [translate_table: standard]
MAMASLLLLAFSSAWSAELQLPVVDLEKSNWKERALEVLQKDASSGQQLQWLLGSGAGCHAAALRVAGGLQSRGPPTAAAPVVRGYFGIGAESGTRASRFECKDTTSDESLAIRFDSSHRGVS